MPEQNKQYWDQTPDGGSINTSRSRILQTLNDVISKNPTIRSKSTSTRIQRAFFLAKAGANGHPWAAITFLVVVCLVGAFWGRGRMISNSRKRSGLGAGGGGFFRLDGKEGILGTSQGKVD